MTKEELKEIKEALKPKEKKPVVKKSRCYALELYPEDDEHCKILDYIMSYFEYAYILHDKDKWENDVIDEKTNVVIYKAGDNKKSHWHVMISLKNPRTEKSLKEELGINHIEPCNFYAYSRYLIHKDRPKKYQYSREEIHTNMQLRIDNALERDYNQAEQEIRILYKYITSQNFITFRQLTDYAIENDCLSTLVKNTYFFKTFCDESGYRRW